MQNARCNTTFFIDGYEVSATFTDSRNTEAIDQIKQILLSSFASRPAKHRPGDILAIGSEQRDNIDGGSRHAP